MAKGVVRSWRLDLVAILALLVALNLLTATALHGWPGSAAQVAAAVGTVVAARWRGYGRDELGISPEAAGAGLRLGALGAAIVVAGVAVAAVLPTSSAFTDDRFVDLSAGEVALEIGARIPLVTALSEELLFRSVLLAVLLVGMSRTRAVLVSSALFGLWHVLTTLGDLGGNETTEDLSGWGVAAGTLGVVLVTAVAGVIFCALRLRSGSVVAPWLLHTAINGSAFVAGVVLAG